jgi:hypothetical protein
VLPTPLPVIPNTFRCALNWRTGAGQIAVNVFHIGTAAPSTAAAVMEVLDDTVTGAMWGMVSSQWAVDHVAITPLDGTSATQSFIPGTPAHWVGGTGGDFVPAVSGLMKLTTLARGRAHRGRLYLPPPAEAQISNGVFVDGTPGTSTTGWTAFQAALLVDPDTPCQVVVASYDRKHGGAGAGAGTVTAFLGETACATQRRRQGRLR